MTDAQIKQCTAKIKALADVRRLAIEDTDVVIKTFHDNLNSTEEKSLIPDLTMDEKKEFAKAEAELNGVPEKRELDETVDAEANVAQAKKSRLDAAA